MGLQPLTSRAGMGQSLARQAPSGSVLGCGPPGEAGGAGALNRLTVAPVFIPAGTTIDHVWWSQTAAAGAGGLFRPGLYSCDPVLAIPGALLLDVGTQAADGANGDKQIAITALAFEWDTVVYAGGVYQTAAGSLRRSYGASAATFFPFPFGAYFQGGGANGDNGIAFRQDGVTGALPAVFNTPSYTVLGTVTTAAPYIALQVQ